MDQIKHIILAFVLVVVFLICILVFQKIPLAEKDPPIDNSASAWKQAISQKIMNEPIPGKVEEG